MSDSRYHGRHRSRRRTGLTPRIIGAGLVLPTTATLAVVSATAGQAPATDTVLASATFADGTAAAQAELAVRKTADATTLARGITDRAARDSERVRRDVVAAENEKRAAAEAALAQGTDPVQVSLTAKAATANVPGRASSATAPAMAVGSKAWVNPVPRGAYSLTSPFGPRWGRLHAGQDFGCPTGTPVSSISSGTVIFAGWQSGYGNKVEIRHWDGTVSYYAHNSRLKVTKGASVAPGQLIALSGNTGHSTGPHLHLEIHPGGGGPVAPARWLAARGVRI